MPLLDVRHLTKAFSRRGGLFARASRADLVRAVDDVSFSIERGETFGLVGESGSGKTTTGRCILRLIEPSSGEVRFRGEDVLAFTRRRLRQARREMQIVFQDPYSSLNPRMRAKQIVEEPLIIHKLGDRAARDQRVRQLFALVGIDAAHLTRFAHVDQERREDLRVLGERRRQRVAGFDFVTDLTEDSCQLLVLGLLR